MPGYVVLTVDQDGSRFGPDQVPAGLSALAGIPARLAFERTVGDEFQGVLDDAATLVSAVEVLLRMDEWNIGIGVGEIEDPLPSDARAGRGSAYLHARDAVTASKSSPWRVRVHGTQPGVRPLESSIWLWAALLARRTPRGWEVADLVDRGLTYEEVGLRIGISQSAVSQRAAAAGIAEGRRARELVSFLTDLCLRGDA